MRYDVIADVPELGIKRGDVFETFTGIGGLLGRRLKGAAWTVLAETASLRALADVPGEAPAFKVETSPWTDVRPGDALRQDGPDRGLLGRFVPLAAADQLLQRHAGSLQPRTDAGQEREGVAHV